MKLIERVENDLGGSWRVRFTIDGSQVNRSFTDWEYGGKGGALRAAQDFLHSMFTPMLSPKISFKKL